MHSIWLDLVRTHQHLYPKILLDDPGVIRVLFPWQKHTKSRPLTRLLSGWMPMDISRPSKRSREGPRSIIEQHFSWIKQFKTRYIVNACHVHSATTRSSNRRGPGLPIPSLIHSSERTGGAMRLWPVEINWAHRGARNSSVLAVLTPGLVSAARLPGPKVFHPASGLHQPQKVPAESALQSLGCKLGHLKSCKLQ